MSFKHFEYKGVTFADGVYTKESLAYAENEFEVLDDDIYNLTYPKSGSNWMIQILNLIKHKGDLEKSNAVPIFMRSPWYEAVGCLEEIQKMKSPRILSSHLPHHIFAKSFFKSKAKIIYTMRNPKDIIVSLFHYTKILKIFEPAENFQNFIEDFIQGKVLGGSWFDHIKGWMQMKDDSRFFFITYEELIQDIRGSVVRICKFLGQELDDAQIDLVVKYSTFKSMEENKMTNWSQISPEIMDQSKGSFMRKGISGDWKNHFTVAQSEYFDKVYQEKMNDININFFWEQLP
ncbi:sulfotransferase 2B1-like isoform X1 [Bufo gargarizans]|uniref:sulfotransferase 2B1-like isoform X1 n=2 Tax=Bufo gargarizans TaxID=30331 RepID=UPI001CF34FD8|nr:sulfotransferase 2B1-like isoform X1 [Bufo gargarizans]XP_044134023.1 sulfotransferase 2B1-like isoform X1 [Bufo gargarizans]XP_044134024.1 sulfotransferase 2B1-like isoform X1 [Bufo gargarizans]XP_044134026.1 sulfotransferase 2B1-like isoform X1 [Bufo gargarizans]XP_044134027.1 sulfotransferase 2B1-like isoform X1 [Bufo gargarizans]XP_044134028.1 sulfotransferase 2B1-like isoform X1 [Bufo gargarizans]XP_044134029.1 sulfotransferase 2B1-like isoform X1 [Bufo gargarizans]XP_044134030.1 sul